METGYCRPIIPLLFSFIIGIVAGYFWPGAGKWAVLIALLILGFLVFKIISHRTTILLPCFLFVFLGYGVISFWTAPGYPENHIVHFLDQGKREITARLSEDPLTKANRTQCYLDVLFLSDKPGHPFDVCGSVRLTILGEPLSLAKGDIIRFSGRIRSIRNFANPGGYNYKMHMAFNGIHGSVYAASDKVVIQSAKSISKKSSPISFQNKVARRIREKTSPTAGAVIKALILGDRSGIGPELRNTINRAGLGHLLAISGLHIGIVASFSFFIGQWLLSFCPWLIRYAGTQKLAALLSIMPVLFYGWFSGMSPSTQRAVIMVCAFMLTFLIERENDLQNTLATAAFIILIVFPPSLFLVSFQLSFAAVWAIVIGISFLPGFSKPESSYLVKSAQYMVSFFAVSFLATIGTLPLVMLYFNQVSLVGWLANVVGIPLIGFLVVPLGLVSTVLAAVSGDFAGYGFFVCGKIVDIAFLFIDFLAGFNLAAIKTISPSILEIICFYSLLAGLFYIRKAVWVRYLILAAFLVLAADVSYWVHRRYFSHELRITVFDIGQGFGSLVELPKGRTLMIDGGGFSDNAVFDVGERIIAPYLWQNKIKTVDLIIASHPNTDHYNGLRYIARYFNVKTVWTNGETADTFAYKAFMQIIHDRQIDRPPFREIPRKQTISGVDLAVLHPEKEFAISPAMSKYANSNDHSIVIKLAYGQSSFLFPGDITRTAEQKLVSLFGNDLESSVLISPHHGSKTSSSDAFLSHVRPETIIIPVGYNNRFHFPHPTVLKKYEKSFRKIFRTDLNGAICIKTDGEKIVFKPTIP